MSEGADLRAEWLKIAVFSYVNSQAGADTPALLSAGLLVRDDRYKLLGMDRAIVMLCPTRSLVMDFQFTAWLSKVCLHSLLLTP